MLLAGFTGNTKYTSNCYFIVIYREHCNSTIYYTAVVFDMSANFAKLNIRQDIQLQARVLIDVKNIYGIGIVVGLSQSIS